MADRLPPDCRPDITDVVLQGISPTPTRNVLEKVARLHRWRAERGAFRDDLHPQMTCRACGGCHPFRVACMLELDVLAGVPHPDWAAS